MFAIRNTKRVYANVVQYMLLRFSRLCLFVHRTSEPLVHIHSDQCPAVSLCL